MLARRIQVEKTTKEKGTVSPKRVLRQRFLGSRFFLGVFVGIFAGMVLGGVFRPIQARVSRSQRKRWTPYRKLVEFTKVLHHIESDYVDRVDSEKLVYGAIQGMLDRLDPHSRFFPKEHYRHLLMAATGVYAGIGVSLERRGRRVFVKDVLKGGPAAKALLQRGDEILNISGVSVQGTSVVDLVRKLRGKSGTTVKLLVMRGGWSSPRQIGVKRATLRQPSVDGTVLLGHTAFVKIKAFHPGTSKELNGMLQKLVKGVAAKGSKIKHLVLDLRNNPGGLMSEALRVSDLFVSKGLLLVKRGKKGRLEEKYWASRKAPWSHLRVVLLVDGRTASAAEIVAAALKDNKKAKIVGRNSFGKGSFQELIKFSEGSVLKLTVGRYYTPSGKSLDGVGVKPDWRVLTGPLPPGTPVPKGLPPQFKNDAPLVVALSVLLGTLTNQVEVKHRI